MLTIMIVASFILSSIYIHIESVIYGLSKRRWTCGALLLGPMLLPMFEVSKHMALRKAGGFNNVYFSA
ncbi:hypothetical protein KJ365_03430 [Glaciecola sp. XM2]|jgi:hypothetical protein|uniref:hypothetical protein n=1 Tax=Glaciecola sp. XM2 TaxID=1914931 RepID=UPI001BDE4199|nr:hypothetical protein [Glaciecola sp. XM2]MBT1449920.1 hypothetical protein [Glaciecola sp. XM2]